MRALMYALVFLLSAGIATALPYVGQTGIDTTYVNSWSGSTYYNTNVNEWIVCRADESSAWVAAYDSNMNIQPGDDYSVGQPGGNYDTYAVCASLGYATVDAWGGTCGTVCGYCEAHYGGYENYDFGSSPSNLHSTVHWRCAQYVGPVDGGEIPEFTSIGAALALLGAAGYIAFRKRK
ncbi:hypothetical protein JXB02_01140 [Candidatus Woesearchaeota archaeon]|nr:hypothetical protein [Candidatus Woesearchaeota archaeon]